MNRIDFICHIAAALSLIVIMTLSYIDYIKFFPL